jgi:D-glycero-alpha-D-manno-heptose 1-phosphate guanylyltransferase
MSSTISADGLKVVILAGGFGTRVAHLLPDIPKPMAPVCGRPFVEWIVRYFAKQGVRDFVLSTGHLAARIESHFQAQPVQGVTVRCRKETTPLGTAGGFLNAVGDQDSTNAGWFVANGDSLVVTDPTVLFRQASAMGWDAAILGLSLPDASRFGSLAVKDDGTLKAFAEKRPGAGLINAGVYWFSSQLLSRFSSKRPLSFEFDVFPSLLADGAVVGVVSVAAPFIDIGTETTLAEAETFIATNLK